MGFRQLDYGLLTKVYFLKMTFFPVEISSHLMTFLMEMHVAVVHHRLGKINRRKYKAVHPALKICIRLQMSQIMAFHQQRNESQLIKYCPPSPKPTAHNEMQMKKGAQKAILLTSSPYKDHLKFTKEKQNSKELKQQYSR
jgi:hypothetical protein